MKRSQHLLEQIDKLRTVLNEMESGGLWSYFKKDFVDPMDKTAFKDWKTIPASQTNDIIETQQQGKLADEIMAWPKKLEQQIEIYALELEAINRDEAEDPEEDIAA